MKPASVVTARLADMAGKRVSVRTLWEEVFEAEFVAVLPLGRDYAAKFNQDGRVRVLALRAVLEIAEV